MYIITLQHFVIINKLNSRCVQNYFYFLYYSLYFIYMKNIVLIIYCNVRLNKLKIYVHTRFGIKKGH
jgi:hypothetical protein